MGPTPPSPAPDRLVEQVADLRSTLDRSVNRLTEAVEGLRTDVQRDDSTARDALAARVDQLAESAVGAVTRLVDAMATIERQLDRVAPAAEAGTTGEPIAGGALIERLDDELRPLRRDLSDLRRHLTDGVGPPITAANRRDVMDGLDAIRNELGRLASFTGALHEGALPDGLLTRLDEIEHALGGRTSEARRDAEAATDELKVRVDRITTGVDGQAASVAELHEAVESHQPLLDAVTAELDAVGQTLRETATGLEVTALGDLLDDLRATTAAAATDESLSELRIAVDATRVRIEEQRLPDPAVLDRIAEVLVDLTADDALPARVTESAELLASARAELEALRVAVEARTGVERDVLDPDLTAELRSLRDAVAAAVTASEAATAAAGDVDAFTASLDEFGSRLGADAERMRTQIAQSQNTMSTQVASVADELGAAFARERERIIRAVAGSGEPAGAATDLAPVQQALRDLRTMLIENRGRQEAAIEQLNSRLDAMSRARGED